ncbi:hypothetical protein SDRG_14495 [Saprolegnia diclina VS20]|uniref:F-box domain-containing protein n=1 Tax=Saprolegnia diclina (strain VS20) TaxID=1156394 RepID=T0PZR7_SAPDV|nr:hypothetical protein SDRG_14495 [Saprolegnia diclina VS20]EQC27746.1 hypothetical protein SDRG_14495 [Saprolegnia diclina VS20]|eukprot:XP_008618851.1 hypothetical protein SDRG_14495 [Saprolegnia diclina VS20]
MAAKAPRRELPGPLQPRLIEAIAGCLQMSIDFDAFLNAMPRPLWTPAMTAWRTLSTNAAMAVTWPSITLHQFEYAPNVLSMLRSTLSLGPHVTFNQSIIHACELAAVVPTIGPAIKALSLAVEDEQLHPGEGQAVADLVRQCSSLRELKIESTVYMEGDPEPELDALLGAVAHPTVRHLELTLFYPNAPRLGTFLSQWLQSAPAKKLCLLRVTFQDGDAFCDGVQANRTLVHLDLHEIEGIDGLRGRRLPSSLRYLVWGATHSGDSATLDNMAHALERTRLKHLRCAFFEEVASRPAAWPMLPHLTSLDTGDGMNVAQMQLLLEALARLASLKELKLANFGFDASTFDVVLPALVIHCPYLTDLDLQGNACDDETIKKLLAVAPQLPRLRHLTASRDQYNVLGYIPELVAAGRHLKSLSMDAPGRRHHGIDAKLKMFRALAKIQDQPFYVGGRTLDTCPRILPDMFLPNTGTVDPTTRCRLAI